MKNVSMMALFMLLFAACQQDPNELATPVAQDHLAKKSQSTREFRGNLSSSVNTDPSIPLTACSGDIPEFGVPDHFLAGQALHIGNLNSALSTLHHDDCNISVATMLLTTAVSGQLAAANGDLIYYSGDDEIDVSALLTQSGTTGSISGTWTINGGTGRFENASGSFTINGVVDFVTGTFTALAEGTITY